MRSRRVFHRKISRFSDGCPYQRKLFFSKVGAEIGRGPFSARCRAHSHFGKTKVSGLWIQVPNGNLPEQSSDMSAVPELAWAFDPKPELKVLFQHAPIVVAHCQRRGPITTLNPRLEQWLGGASSGTRTLMPADLFQHQDRERGQRLLRELFEGERESFELDAASRNGRKLHWTAWRVADANGEPDYALAIVQDSTDGVAGNVEAGDAEVQRHLRQAQKLEAVGRLAGGVAHDFNNLLTGVLLYCDLLIASLAPDQRGRKYAEEIRNASLQASKVVRQLLTVARPTNYAPTLLSLNQVAEGMRDLLVRLIGENIELRLHLDPNLGLVRIDPTQAQQVLLNLVLNARDALPNGGQIAIETASCKVQVLAEDGFAGNGSTVLPCALFVVSDNGSGMDDSTRAHLFEAFFTTKAEGQGTGLGLATVHDIVTSNGGLIHVDSAPASGTRVTILLPQVLEAAMNSQPEDVLQSEPIEGVHPAKKEE
jgi:signal transduction histidine kinase